MELLVVSGVTDHSDKKGVFRKSFGAPRITRAARVTPILGVKLPAHLRYILSKTSLGTARERNTYVPVSHRNLFTEIIFFI